MKPAAPTQRHWDTAWQTRAKAFARHGFCLRCEQMLMLHGPATDPRMLVVTDDGPVCRACHDTETPACP